MDTTIKIDSDFKEFLRKKGEKGETFQCIIKRLIKYKEVPRK